MKKSLFTIIASIALLAGAKASAAITNHTILPVTFQITAISVPNASGVSVTNAAKTVTTTVRSTTNALTSANILQMIATEFNTNFPSGSRLAMSLGFDFLVVDSQGKVLLNAASNPSDDQYFFAISNNVPGDPVISGGAFFGKITTYTNGSFQFAPLTFAYSDYSVYYRDSHTNNFHFGGYFSYSYSQNFNAVTTNSILPNVMVTLSGPGGGKIVHPTTHVPVAVVFPKAQFNAAGQRLVSE